MQISGVNNNSFGARISKDFKYVKKICMDAGLSPELYKREVQKIQTYFPGTEYKFDYCDGILGYSDKNGKKWFNLYSPNPKYLIAKIVGTCRKISECVKQGKDFKSIRGYREPYYIPPYYIEY